MGLDLTIRDLKVTSQRGRDILSVPTLDIAAGSLVGIAGPSGAGKSTLLYALAGMLEAKGRIVWNDTNLLTLREEQRTAFRASNIGMIFQDFLLFEELSAAANASLTSLYRPRAQRAGIRQRAAERLAALGLKEPNRSVASYSGGERQRVAIARALSANAPVLLADEPTASLDRAAADKLIEDLVALARTSGTTLIAVSHDQHLIDRMDRVLTVSDGKISEQRGQAA